MENHNTATRLNDGSDTSNSKEKVSPVSKIYLCNIINIIYSNYYVRQVCNLYYICHRNFCPT